MNPHPPLRGTLSRERERGLEGPRLRINSRRMSYLTDAPIDSQELVKRVMRKSDGACVIFEGVVRDHQQGKRVESIFYDAYRPLAEKEITRIISDVSIRITDVAAVDVHWMVLL